MVQATGQTIGLPNGSFSAVKLLMTAVNGNQPNQTFTVHYADGTNAQITQGVSDWFTPQNYSNNEAPVGPMTRDTSSGGSDNRNFYLYLDQFSLDGAKTISSITLPNNKNVEILAMEMV